MSKTRTSILITRYGWFVLPAALLYMMAGFVPSEPTHMFPARSIRVGAIAGYAIYLIPVVIAIFVYARKNLAVWTPIPKVDTRNVLWAAASWVAFWFLVEKILGSAMSIDPDRQSLGMAFLVQFLVVKVLVRDKELGEELPALFSWHRLNDQGVKQDGSKLVGMGLLAGIVTLWILSVGYFAGAYLRPEQIESISFSTSFILRRDLIEVLFAIAFIPLMEEILFRAGLMGWLQKYAGMWGAIVVSAIVFSVLHMQGEIFWARLIAGLFLGWLYARSGSLIPCFFLHALMNAGIIFVPLFWGTKGI